MNNSNTELQLVKFDGLHAALDELKARFVSLAETGNKLQQSFQLMTKSLMFTPPVNPVMVPYPPAQQATARSDDGSSGALKKFGEKALEKFTDKAVNVFVDWSFKKLFGDKESSQKKNPIGFRGPGESEGAKSSWLNKLAASGPFGSVLASPVSKAGAGKTTALVFGTAGAGYGLGTLLYKSWNSSAKTVQPGVNANPNTNLNMSPRAASVIAALPVFVTNWPSSGRGAGSAETQSGKSSNKVLDTLADKGMDQLFDFASKKISNAGGVLSLISKVPSFLPASWLSGLAGMGKVGAALAAPVGAAGAATTTAFVGASAVAGYGIGTLLNKGMGWVSEKVSGGKYGGEGWLGSMIYDVLHPSETQVQNQNTINVVLKVDKDNRLYADTSDMNTSVNLKRGELLSTGDK